MGELPPFITGVPAETLSPQDPSNELTRANSMTSFEFVAGAGNVSLLEVPKGLIFEVTHIQTSAVNLDVPVSITKFTLQRAKDLGSSEANITHIILDHNEHQTLSQTFEPLSLIIRENEIIKGKVNNDTSGNSIFAGVIIGNFINVSELVNAGIVL